MSKLHARVANYRDIAGSKVKFKAVTNGVDMDEWIFPPTLEFMRKADIIDAINLPTPDYADKLPILTADKIRELKRDGRKLMNELLKNHPDQNGKILKFDEHDLLFDFRRRFVDYKRPDLPFRNPSRLRNILERHNAHYILAGRVHAGDSTMSAKLHNVLELIEQDDYLKTHVHYIPDYDEEVAYALSIGCNAAINVPIVGLEACGTSWMKDVANLNLLISTHDGGVADGSQNSYLNVSGKDEAEELDVLYQRMEDAAQIWENDFDLEYNIWQQLKEFLPVISGARMMNDYLDYLFPK